MSETTHYFGFVDVELAVPFAIDLENVPAEFDSPYEYAQAEFIKQFNADPMKFIGQAIVRSSRVDDYLQITDAPE